AVFSFAEDFDIRLEGDSSAGFYRLTDFFERLFGVSTMVSLEKDFPFSFDFDFESFGQRIYHRDANAMKTARNSIGTFFKFSASVKFGENDFGGRDSFTGMNLSRNASSVICDCDAVVYVEGDTDSCAVSC